MIFHDRWVRIDTPGNGKGMFAITFKEKPESHILARQKLEKQTGWFTDKFRVFGGGFRQVFWKVLICFSKVFGVISQDFLYNSIGNPRKIRRKPKKNIGNT